jgi:hypothetical protein
MASILSNNSYSTYANGQNSNNSAYPFFTKEGIASSQLKLDKQGTPVRFRILPSLDLESVGAENFYKTVVPYKNADGTLTNWAVMIKGYTYFGSLKNHLLSPATYYMDHNYPPRWCDPIKDLSSFIKFNDKKCYPNTNTPIISDEERLLINGVQGDIYSKVLPMKPRVFALVNALVENATTKEWNAQILGIPEYVFEAFIDKPLKEKAGRDDKIVDPNFSNFLFGDVTSVNCGCIIEARLNPKLKIGSMELYVSADNESLVGHQVMPVSEEHLLQRRFLHDADNVLDVKSKQDLLDILCKDPAIPLETIHKAFEMGAFDPSLQLNLDLREEGIEIMRKREERKNNEAASSVPFSGVKTAKTSQPVASEKVVNAKFTASNTATLPFATPISVGVNANAMPVMQQPEATPNPSVTELESAIPPSFEQEDGVDEGEIPMGEAEKPVVQPMSSEQEEFAKLQAQITANPQSLDPKVLNRYIELSQKLSSK